MSTGFKLVQYRRAFTRGGVPFFLLLLLFFFFGCSPDSAPRRFEEAERLLGQGRYTEALARYNLVASEYAGSPFAPKSLLRSGLIYRKFLGDRKSAIKAYYTLYTVYPESREAYEARKALAAMYSADGDHTKAVEQYQWLLDNTAARAERERIQFTIALEYFRMNDFRQARTELKDLVEGATVEDIKARAFLLRANAYYVEGKTEEAIKAFEETIARFPDHEATLEARFNLAKALEEADRGEEALALLSGLKDEYPNKEAIVESIKWIKKRMREKRSRRRR